MINITLDLLLFVDYFNLSPPVPTFARSPHSAYLFLPHDELKKKKSFIHWPFMIAYCIHPNKIRASQRQRGYDNNIK